MPVNTYPTAKGRVSSVRIGRTGRKRVVPSTGAHTQLFAVSEELRGWTGPLPALLYSAARRSPHHVARPRADCNTGSPQAPGPSVPATTRFGRSTSLSRLRALDYERRPVVQMVPLAG
jgi:hypothetical protein